MAKNFDNVLIKIGQFGKAQIILYVLIGLCGIPTGEQNLASVFLGATQSHWCRVESLNSLPIEKRLELAIPLKSDGSYHSCMRYNVTFPTSGANDSTNDWIVELNLINEGQNLSKIPTVGCDNGWEFDTRSLYSTVNSQFNLVCDKSYITKLITSVYMAGYLAGCTVGGIVSDKIGRSKTVGISAGLNAIFALLAAFVPNLTLHILFRFCVAATVASMYTTAFVIAMEVIGPSYRMQPGIFVQGWFAVGFLLLAGLAFFIRNHVTLQIVLGVQPLLFVAYFWLYPESPRWLTAQGRYEEAEKICRMIARVNGVQLEENFSVEACENEKNLLAANDAKEVEGTAELSTSENDEDKEVGESAGIFDLVRTPNMRKRSLNIFFNWFVCSIVYYGLALNSEDLGGSLYVNMCLSGLVEFPAYAMCCFTLNRLGRVKMLAGTLIVGGIGCIGAAFVNISAIKITLAMIGKFAVSASFAIVYVYSAEAFPTVVRNVGVGVASTHARIGGLLAPQVVLLSSIWNPLPFVLIGGLAVAAGFLSFLLPETLGQPLPDTIKQGEEFGNKSAAKTEDANDDAENRL